MALGRWLERLLRMAGRRQENGFPEEGDARISNRMEFRVHSSASGEYSLEVDPSERDGSGPAEYRALRSGKEVWKKRLPFTLREVVIADCGAVAGYAYSHGPQSGGLVAFDDPGDFRIVILDPSGEFRLNLATPREISLLLHAEPFPFAAGIFLDPDNDRLTVRLHDAERDRGLEEWWPFQLSTGAVLPTFSPARLMADHRRYMSIIDARPVPGTPLTLVHWWRHEYRLSEVHSGARFTLIDLDGYPLWCLDLPDDYTFPEDRDAMDRCRRWIWRHGAILGTDQPAEFELRHVAARQRVRYSVRQKGDRWKVSVRQRRPYLPSSPAPDG